MATQSHELTQRESLAAAHRLAARSGWEDLIFTMFTATVPGNSGQLLVTPYGYLCRQVTGSSLLLVDMNGQCPDGQPAAIDQSGYPLYAAIHQARPDVQCVLHLHTPAGIAVSVQPDGLQPLSQTAMLLMDDVACVEYTGIGGGDVEAQIASALGDKNCLLLRNHGTLTTGRSVAEAYLRMHLFETACAIQIAAQAGCSSPLLPPPAVSSSVSSAFTGFMESGVSEQVWPTLVASLEESSHDWRS